MLSRLGRAKDLTRSNQVGLGSTLGLASIASNARSSSSADKEFIGGLDMTSSAERSESMIEFNRQAERRGDERDLE